MAIEVIKQGLVLPVTNFTVEDFSYLERTLEEAPGFQNSHGRELELLSRFDYINMPLIRRKELMALEGEAKSPLPDSTYDVAGLDNFLKERFAAISPSEIPATPARIVGNKINMKRGIGTLVVAMSFTHNNTREALHKALAEFYGLSATNSSNLFNNRFVPTVRLAYSHNIRELRYLRHLQSAINAVDQVIMPSVFELGEITVH